MASISPVLSATSRQDQQIAADLGTQHDGGTIAGDKALMSVPSAPVAWSRVAATFT